MNFCEVGLSLQSKKMKETFYLRHDYNSRNDEKILRLRKKYPDGSGYAIYWMLLEKLAESSEGRLKLSNIDDIAFDIRFSCERIADVVNQYELFECDDIYFWSNRLLSDLSERDEKSRQGKLAAKIRWDKERKKMQTHCISNADAIAGKERKGKKEYKKEINKEKKSKDFSIEEKTHTPPIAAPPPSDDYSFTKVSVEINRDLMFEKYKWLTDELYKSFVLEAIAWCESKGKDVLRTSRLINWINVYLKNNGIPKPKTTIKWL